MSSHPEMTSDVNEAAPEVEEKPRFCSSCSRTKPVLGGALVRCANGTKRWKCADCRARSKAHLEARKNKGEAS